MEKSVAFFAEKNSKIFEKVLKNLLTFRKRRGIIGTTKGTEPTNRKDLKNMIYIVRKSIRRTGRVVFEKTFIDNQFVNGNAYEVAYKIALAEDSAKKDSEIVELLTVSKITKLSY